MRAVSTVFDVTLFVLLVSVAVATLALPASEPPTSTADETVETLVATTTNVTYPVNEADGRTRTATGSVAALLGRAAVANLDVDGHPVVPDTAQFRTAVRERTDSTLAWSRGRTGVTAVWEPYPDAPIRGQVTAGAQPPPGVDVSTATATVPAPVQSVEGTPGRSSGAGYRELAGAIADVVLATIAPSTPATGTPASDRRRDRLQALADALDVASPSGSRDARDAVRRRLADRLAEDMRARFETPAAAAEAVRTGSVRIVVREWSQ